VSTEPEAFLNAHIENRDVVHATRAYRLGQNSDIGGVVQRGRERAPEGLP
jgi:hypothetical protein